MRCAQPRRNLQKLSNLPSPATPHHYHHHPTTTTPVSQLAWSLALLVQHPTDPLLLVCRWVLLGVATQGLAAYGVAPLFDDGAWSGGGYQGFA